MQLLNVQIAFSLNRDWLGLADQINYFFLSGAGNSFLNAINDKDTREMTEFLSVYTYVFGKQTCSLFMEELYFHVIRTLLDRVSQAYEAKLCYCIHFLLISQVAVC